MDNFILESKIKETLNQKAEEVSADPFAAQRIRTNVYNRLEEAEYMKKRNWKKTAMVTAAICVLGSMTALGLGKTVSITGSSSPLDAIQSYEAAEALQSELDAGIKMVEKFSNGYSFKEAVPVQETGTDESGAVTGTETTLMVWYTKAGMPDVTVSSGRMSLGRLGEADEEKVLEDGTVLSYSTMLNKFVPDDYVVTDEERALMEAGKLNIGYGGMKEIQEKVSSSVLWEQDGILYHVLAFSDELGADEMLGMAQEIAESE